MVVFCSSTDVTNLTKLKKVWKKVNYYLRL
uniref:Uncharacterized protein n=1 Tax=Physcomitrium patens TaxID=3218 RepID=A0A2K1ITS6_PHYPA|nr:hypothetical protein PHYPA_024625 [Physcomitrium patens]